jgi:hypothetical protein
MWINSKKWAPHCWNVFWNLVRTNNDCNVQLASKN